MLDRIHWLGHGGFAIGEAPLIYINPWRTTRNGRSADLILISHEHYEHCSQADIDKLRGENTLVIGSRGVAREIENVVVLRPWQSMTFGRISVKAVPAYSLTDPRHDKKHEGLGFVISYNYYDIYYAGDTELIPEMDNIKPDIAILPIDGAGTMTPTQAACAVTRMRPRWVIPCNWGYTGSTISRVDALVFAREVEALQRGLPEPYCEVVIPQAVR